MDTGTQLMSRTWTRQHDGVYRNFYNPSGEWRWINGKWINLPYHTNYAPLCQSIIKQVIGRYTTKKIRITLYYGDCPWLGHFIQFKIKNGQAYYTLCRNHNNKIRGKLLFNPAEMNEQLYWILKKGSSPICTFKIEKIGRE